MLRNKKQAFWRGDRLQFPTEVSPADSLLSRCLREMEQCILMVPSHWHIRLCSCTQNWRRKMNVPSFTLQLFQTCGEKCGCHLPPYSCTQDLRWKMQAPSFTLQRPAILERKAAGAVFTLPLPAKIEVKDEDVELDDSSYAATMTNKYREDAGWYRQL